MKRKHRTVSHVRTTRNIPKSSLDRVIPTRLTGEAPLAQCEIEGCQSVTAVGPLCFTHWEGKVAARELNKTVKLPPTTATSGSSTRLVKHTLTEGRVN